MADEPLCDSWVYAIGRFESPKVRASTLPSDNPSDLRTRRMESMRANPCRTYLKGRSVCETACSQKNEAERLNEFGADTRTTGGIHRRAARV
jgi:hypothetical protein